jgi:hypothetical protein
MMVKSLHYEEGEPHDRGDADNIPTAPGAVVALIPESETA